MAAIHTSSSGEQSQWIARLKARFAEDSALFAVICLFILSTAFLNSLFQRNYLRSAVVQHVWYWFLFASAVMSVVVIITFLYRAWSEEFESLTSLAAELLLDVATPDVVVGMVLYLAFAAFMGAFTSLKTVLPRLNAFWADPWLAQLDRAVHLGHDPWALLHPVLGHPQVTRLIEVVYGPVWIGVITLAPLFFCMRRRDPELRRRFLIGYLLTWITNGCLLAGVFMSGGPAFYGDLTQDHARYGELVGYLRRQDEWVFSAALEQRELWRMHQAASSGLGAGISAFPSLHVSMIVLCCLAAWRVSRRAAWLLIGIAAIIVLGSVHLGWHYAVGDYAVFGLMSGIWWASGRLAGALPGSATSHASSRWRDVTLSA